MQRDSDIPAFTASTGRLFEADAMDFMAWYPAPTEKLPLLPGTMAKGLGAIRRHRHKLGVPFPSWRQAGVSDQEWRELVAYLADANAW